MRWLVVLFIVGVFLLGWGGLALQALFVDDPTSDALERFANVNDWMVRAALGALLGLLAGFSLSDRS